MILSKHWVTHIFVTIFIMVRIFRYFSLVNRNLRWHFWHPVQVSILFFYNIYCFGTIRDCTTLTKKDLYRLSTYIFATFPSHWNKQMETKRKSGNPFIQFPYVDKTFSILFRVVSCRFFTIYPRSWQLTLLPTENHHKNKRLYKVSHTNRKKIKQKTALLSSFTNHTLKRSMVLFSLPTFSSKFKQLLCTGCPNNPCTQLFLQNYS